MKKFIKFFALYLVTVITGWWVSSYVSFYNITPDIIIIVAIGISIFNKEITSFMFAFFCGLFLDFMGSYLFGAYALCLLFAARMVMVLREKIDFHSVFTQVLLVSAMSFFIKISYGLLGLVFTGEILFGELKYLLIVSVINGLIAPLVIAIMPIFSRDK